MTPAGDSLALETRSGSRFSLSVSMGAMHDLHPDIGMRQLTVVQNGLQRL